MLFRRARARESVRQGLAGPRPVFCISLALPLPLLRRAGAATAGQGAPMLHLAFCSAGATMPGWNWQADLACGSPGDAAEDVAPRRASAIAWMAETLAGGVAGLPASLVLRAGALPRGPAERSLARGHRPDQATAPESRHAGAAAPAVPDSFALAMQEWPIPLIAWSGRQAAFVGFMHFCEVLPGLPVPRHRRLRSRLGCADPRPPQRRSSAGGESTFRKRPR